MIKLLGYGLLGYLAIILWPLLMPFILGWFIIYVLQESKR